MSIIIGMVYYVYSSFSKQVFEYRSGVDEELALSNFCLRLKADFFEAEKVVGTTNSFEAIRYDMSRSYYEVKKGYMYRIQNQNRDSLRIYRIDVSSIKDPNTNENLIQSAQMSFLLFEVPIQFKVAKKYLSIQDYKTDYGN